MRSAALAMSHAEVKLLLRNKMVATTATLVPILMAIVMVRAFGSPGMWPLVISTLLLFALGFTVYFTVSTALTSRRQDLYLKRLRNGEPSAATIMIGTLSPVVVLGLAQSAIMIGIAVAFGAPVPRNPLLLLLAVLGGLLMCLAVGVVTSAYTSTAEQAQITTSPFLLALLAGGTWVSMQVDGEVTLVMLAIPGGAVADLVRRSLESGDWMVQLGEAVPSVGIMLLWIVVATLLSQRSFRWEPRH